MTVRYIVRRDVLWVVSCCGRRVPCRLLHLQRRRQRTRRYMHVIYRHAEIDTVERSISRKRQ